VVKINEYIESGILEAYVLGSASEAEAKELLYLKAKHPQIQGALEHLEVDMERIAQLMAISPPPGMWPKIEDSINELVKTPRGEALTVKMPPKGSGKSRKSQDFIEVDGSSSHMRVHKIWRWILIGLFVLGKIFLGFALYFFLQNRQQEEQIRELKLEIIKQQTH
jgi:hypothetical protein